MSERWGDFARDRRELDRWIERSDERDEGTYTVVCELCGREFQANCTGWTVCAGCVNAGQLKLPGQI